MRQPGKPSSLPRARQHVAIDPLVVGATALFAATMLILAYGHSVVLVSTAMLAGGMAWMVLTSAFMVAVQTAVPAWVRARALAVYMLVLQGGIAAGSAVWGVVASHTGLPTALLGAAGGLVVGLAVLARYRVPPADERDVTATLHWDEPVVARPLRPEDGPVLVLIEYRIAPDQARVFARAMRALRRVRLRDGAFRWGLFGDTADPGHYLETFVVASWAEHLRQHERMTVGDREVRNRAMAFHIGEAPPSVSHFISAYTGERG
jgi:MFS family permease